MPGGPGPCRQVGPRLRDETGGEPGVNPNPDKGGTKAPVLLWGSYLWAEGVKKRADYRASLERVRGIEQRHRAPRSNRERELHRVAEWVVGDRGQETD